MLLRSILEGKGVGEREASRILQGTDHLGLVRAQHEEGGVCNQLQRWALGFHLLSEELTQCRCMCLHTWGKPAFEELLYRSQAECAMAETEGNAALPWSSCLLHMPSPHTHPTKRAAANSIVTSAKEKRLKRTPSHNSYFLSSRATAKAVSRCNVSFPTKFLLLSK